MKLPDFVLIALAILAVVVAYALTVGAAEANEKKVLQMLAPSALVSTPNSSGSATAVRVDSIMGTYLTTNYHVVKGHMDELEVEFYGDETKYPAYVHSIDVQNDIAIIITRHKHTAVVEIGKPPDIFDEVICVGASLGRPIAPSLGIVTGVDVGLLGSRFFTRMDCKIAPGNSGGGMFAFQDGKWKLIGMPSMVAAIPTGFGSSAPVSFLGVSVRVQELRAHLYLNNVIRVPPIYGNDPRER